MGGCFNYIVGRSKDLSHRNTCIRVEKGKHGTSLHCNIYGSLHRLIRRGSSSFFSCHCMGAKPDSVCEAPQRKCHHIDLYFDPVSWVTKLFLTNPSFIKSKWKKKSKSVNMKILIDIHIHIITDISIIRE